MNAEGASPFSLLAHPHVRCWRSGYALVQRCLVLYLQGALECGALFQPLVVVAHGIGELLRQTQVTGQHEGVVD